MKNGISLLSVLWLAASGSAFAQQPEPQPGVEPDQPEGAVTGIEEQDTDIAAAVTPTGEGFLTQLEHGFLRTDELEGSNVLDAAGEKIGDIDSVLIDEQTGEVTGVVVKVGGVAGIGSRSIGLPWDALQLERADEGGDGVFQGNRYEVRAQISRQEIENAPEFEGEGSEGQIDNDL